MNRIENTESGITDLKHKSCAALMIRCLADCGIAHAETAFGRLIQNAITEVLKDRTSIVVAHRLSTIRNADRILVIRDGGIVEEGNHETLLKQHGYYYDLYMHQYKEDALQEALQ